MIILSIDLGKFNSVACVFDTETNEFWFRKLETSPAILGEFVAETFADQVVIEACSLMGWMGDLCESLPVPLLVASPLEEAWSWKTVKRKTDRDDALKLAKLAALGQITPVHVPSLATRQFRGLVVYRKRIVAEINRVKNRIRSVFVSLGFSMPQRDQAWSVAGKGSLRKMAKPLAACEPSELWRGQLDLDLTHLQQLEEQLKGIEKKLDAIGKHYPAVEKLREIKGVGPVVAQTIAAWIDDPKRFKSGRQVSAYAGLVPRRYQSGKMDRSGRINKRGAKLLRTHVVEAAWIVIRYNPWARQLYERIHRGQKTRKKQAIVAVARKLLVRCWAMMRREEAWSPPEPQLA